MDRRGVAEICTVADSPSSEGCWIRLAVERYEQPLVLYAARLLRDGDGARDVVQEVFCRLCRQRRDRVGDHLAEWLYAVCRNVALDLIRKDRRMKPLSTTIASADSMRAPAANDSAREADLRESTSRVQTALKDLPAKQQEVVRLKFQHGLSYRQISAVTHESVSNVGYLLHHGLKTLRHKLACEAD